MWDQHLKTLRKVLQELCKAGLTVNPAKCQLAQRETEYLGFQIRQGQICPLGDMVRALSLYEKPQTKKQVWAFLGLVNYYCRFLPQFSKTTIALTNLMQSQEPNQIQWTVIAQEAFK